MAVVASYISPKAVKGRPSEIEGRGLVAVAPIAKDEIVAIKGGHLADTAALHALPERLRNSDVQIADGFHLVALEEAEYEPVMLFIMAGVIGTVVVSMLLPILNLQDVVK